MTNDFSFYYNVTNVGYWQIADVTSLDSSLNCYTLAIVLVIERYWTVIDL